MTPEAQAMLDEVDGNYVLALTVAVRRLADRSGAVDLPRGSEVLVWHPLAESKPDVGVVVLGRRSGGTIDVVRLAEDGKFYNAWSPWPIPVELWAVVKGPA